jgi:hypothetical protein
MAEPVTIERLAQAKQISADVLRSFGLVDVSEGVKFEYRNSDGSPARPRLRTAMRGVDGSQWVSPSTLPIAIYTAPAEIKPTVDPESLIIVEGESDCWAAWLHGVAACGIPGSKHFDKLDRDHVVPVRKIYLLREPASPDSPTYDDGVEAYLQNIESRLRDIGYRGDVYELRMPLGLFDLSELHQDDPGRFLERLAAAKQAATPWRASPEAGFTAT